ncbi:hypothetical protein [Xanthobacter sp.]|uniref:hypothetical protein n=1 Tax=Xanthobacter sp. TaxID=35809 RepID=UPI0025DC6764|nr:hypothetical protein [Xanthobacter sp.]
MNRLTPLRKIGQHTFDMGDYLVDMGNAVVRGGFSLKDGVAPEPTRWLRASSQRLHLSVDVMRVEPDTVSVDWGPPSFEFWGSDLGQLIREASYPELKKRFPIHIEGGKLSHVNGYNAADNGGAATQTITSCLSRSQLTADGVRLEIEGELETENIPDLGDHGAQYIVPYFSLLLLIPLELALIESHFSHPLLELAYDAARSA